MENTEPQWLYNLRKKNWDLYNETPLPERAVHLWKYTEPAHFVLDGSEPVMTHTQVLPPTVPDNSQPLESEYSGYSHKRPDSATRTAIEPALAARGVIFKDLCMAAKENESLVARHLGRLIDHSMGKFEALNSALWTSGLFLYVPDNVAIPKPIRLQRHTAGQNTFLRLLILVGNNSEVTIIDDYAEENTQRHTLVNSAVEIFVGESSRVNYAGIQRFSNMITSYITQRSVIGRDSKSQSVFGALGGNISKANVGTILDGRGAESKMSGVLFGNGTQHFDYHTLHHHKDDESISDIDFKVILKDKATSAYTGLIRINEDALNCEAFQMNRNLLLNRGPKAESIPELEILCDQVRCSHGATMGPIDPEMLFYLKSRGMSHDEAVKTVVSGFVEPTLGKLPAELGKMFRAMVQTRLEEH